MTKGDLGIRTTPIVPIVTERIILRALTSADLSSVHSILSDEMTARDVSWRQESREAASAWLERRIRDESIYGMSMWAVEDRHSGEVIGLVGPFPKGEATTEIGYVIHAAHWNRGYATEAVCCAVRSLTATGCRLYATIRPSNKASVRVAGKAGLHWMRSYEDQKGEMHVYES